MQIIQLFLIIFSAIMVGEKRKISINTTPTGKKDIPCRVHVTNPKGATTELFTSKTPEGEETYFTPTDLGDHKVKVEAAGQEVPGSEFPVKVVKFEQRIDVEGLDTRKCMLLYDFVALSKALDGRIIKMA